MIIPLCGAAGPAASGLAVAGVLAGGGLRAVPADVHAVRLGRAVNDDLTLVVIRAA